MKNLLTIFTVLLLLLPFHFMEAQSTNGNGASQGRENWFPNRGNVGIGTRTPAEALEVLGNVRVSQTIFTNSLESTTSINGATLKLSGNGFINGYLGLGVTSPTERLDVFGNIRLSGTLFAQGLDVQTLNANTGTFNTLTVNQNSTFHGLSFFNQNVTFSKDALVNGRLGIGVSSATEALDVLGNIKASAGLFSSTLNTGAAQLSTINVSGNSIFNGLVGIGVPAPSEKLHVGGNLKVDNSIFSNSLTTSDIETGKFTAIGLSVFRDNSSFEKNVTVSGKVGIGVSIPSESLDVNGNLKLTGGITAATLTANEGSFSQSLSAGNTAINGTLDVTGNMKALALSITDINVANNVSITNGLSVSGTSQLSVLNTTGNVAVGQNLNVGGAADVTGNLSVSGQLNARTLSLTDINASSNVAIGNRLSVTGSSQLRGGAVITGNSSVAGDLQISGKLTSGDITSADISSTGNVAISENLTVTGSGQLGGDMNVAGKVIAGVIEAAEFRSPGGGSPFNFDNAVISQTLSVSADRVPTNYKMAVGGNIIATGIDIKIPQKWPDYVFTPEHQRMTLEELQEYIDTHGHLPGIASAQEMEEKENYSVSEMDAKLLEKIEEMALYILELKKEINELKSQKTQK